MLFKEYNAYLFLNFFTTYNDGEDLEEENIIKDIRNLFRLKKEQNCTPIKGIGNFFKQEKETKAVNDRVLRNIKNLFQHEKENYY